MVINDSVKALTLKLITSLLAIGCITTIAGLWGIFYPFLSVILLIPLGLLAFIAFKCIERIKAFTRTEKIIVVLIAGWWLLHSLQVFVPETGFDALWYHLPVTQRVVERHGFYVDPALYQSFNPLFSDSIFYLGYMAAGELGTKIVAYGFGLALLIASYVLSRKLLTRMYALLFVAIISGFQVISWQSSSFYIDVAKAMWEIAALLFIFEKQKVKAGFALGASLASKVFSLLLLPLYFVLALINNSKRDALIITVTSLLIAAPYYWFSYSATGNPFYSASHHVVKLGEIGGEGNVFTYLAQRTIKLPLLPIEVVKTKEYTSFLLVLLFPLIFVFRQNLRTNKLALSLLLFTATQLLIWWYLPPLSVRYSLSGFITGTLLVIYLLRMWWKQKKYKENTLIILLMIACTIFLPIRLIVASRSIEYLSGTQTKGEYLQQFLDGNIDHVLKKWHEL